MRLTFRTTATTVELDVPAVAARLAGVELTNLGFGTNALLDPFVARAIRDADVDLISLEIGANLVTSDLMVHPVTAFGRVHRGFDGAGSGAIGYRPGPWRRTCRACRRAKGDRGRVLQSHPT